MMIKGGLGIGDWGLGIGDWVLDLGNFSPAFPVPNYCASAMTKKSFMLVRSLQELY